MNKKQKVRIKIQQMNLDILSNQCFVGVNILFVLVYPNPNNDSKRFFAQKQYLPKDIIKNYYVIINEKKFHY